MAWLKHIDVKTWIGIEETNLDPGKINWIVGKRGSGKTSLIEAIEKAFTNKNRRTEVIRHGADEARIFIQTTDGLEIERKIRNGKADYLKVRKPGESVPSTEAFLKKLINGEIFRPLEFVQKSPEEQAKIILNMLDIPWTMGNITDWFGELPKDVNYEAHILQVLKQIETQYYAQREAVNREIKVLEAQVSGIRNELPPNYDGEKWRSEKLSDYYNKVAQAEEVNRKIELAKSLIDGLESRIATIKAEAETDKQARKNAFDRQRSEGREFIQFLNQKVEKAEEIVGGIGGRLTASDKFCEDALALNIANENAAYQRKIQELKELHELEISRLKDCAKRDKTIAKDLLDEEERTANENIAKCKNSLSAKEQELLNIDTLEEQALIAIDEKMNERIETEKAKTGNVENDSKKDPIDIVPLQTDADKISDMQSYLREFDRMKDIITTKLAPRQEQAQMFTARIEKARELPMELLKIAAVPIPEIAVDGDGRIRIGPTLLSDLSEGEQLELAFRVAKAQAGDLKVICIDGINKINPSDRKWIEEEMATDDLQYFVLSTDEGDLRVDIEEGVV